MIICRGKHIEYSEVKTNVYNCVTHGSGIGRKKVAP